MYKEIKNMELYKTAYVIGVFVPTKRKFKVKNLYRKILADGKVLAFISTVDSKVSFRMPPPNSFNDVYMGDGVYEVSKSYKEKEPDLILLECNDRNRSVYYGIEKYSGKVPIIGVNVPYLSGRSRNVNVEFMIGLSKKEMYDY